MKINQILLKRNSKKKQKKKGKGIMVQQSKTEREKRVKEDVTLLIPTNPLLFWFIVFAQCVKENITIKTFFSEIFKL
jgi:hypothetical protein